MCGDKPERHGVRRVQELLLTMLVPMSLSWFLLPADLHEHRQPCVSRGHSCRPGGTPAPSSCFQCSVGVCGGNLHGGVQSFSDFFPLNFFFNMMAI